MSENVEMLDFEAFKERYEKVPVEEYPNNVREAVPEPVVSVHLLTYNHADYIREAIESVLMQEVDFPMEIVLGDDDSSDGTREICIEYAEQYPDLIRLQLHHRENNIHLHGGPTHLFQYWYNTLSARGKYIAILSGDDYWTDPLKLQKQYNFMEENPEYSYCYHRFQRLIEAENTSGSPKMTSKYKEGWASPATILSKNVFKKIPPVSLDVLHEDTISKRMLDCLGERNLLENIEPSVYRIHQGGIYGPRQKLGKRFELFRSNVKIIPYFSDSHAESHIRKDLDRIVKGVIRATSALDIRFIYHVVGMAFRNEAGKQVTIVVLGEIPSWIKQRIYDIARSLLPERMYSYAKSIFSTQNNQMK